MSTQQAQSNLHSTTDEPCAHCQANLAKVLHALDVAETESQLTEAEVVELKEWLTQLVSVLEGEEREEVAKASAPDWACRNCGFTGLGFHTIQHAAGDYDVQCPECGSTSTSELAEAVRTVVDARDDALSEIERLKAKVEDASREMLISAALVTQMSANMSRLEKERDAARAQVAQLREAFQSIPEWLTLVALDFKTLGYPEGATKSQQLADKTRSALAATEPKP